MASTFTAKLRLLNSGDSPTRMHILPPSTPFFSMAVRERRAAVGGEVDERHCCRSAVDAGRAGRERAGRQRARTGDEAE